MNLNDLLRSKDIDAVSVLVLRHRPHEPELRKVLPWLAAERPIVFNAYQQTQKERAEGAISRAKHVVSLIGHEPGAAVFVGLYVVGGARAINRKQFWEIPGNIELQKFGMKGFTHDEPRRSILLFDLRMTDFYADWKGKLILGWPPPERAWFRWARQNEFPVRAILQESALDCALPEWDAIDLRWDELDVVPRRLKEKLSEWRGIYYIFDISDRKGYVGAAYGKNNLLGRWQNYAAKGHGGNSLLRRRDPKRFRFSILQRVSPDMEREEVIRLEATWKERLHTRQPFGLNDN